MIFFTFVGWSESGKTTLISALTHRLREQGRRVVVLKHAPHGIDLQPEGKDSRRFLEAGAQRVIVLADRETMTLLPPLTAPTHTQLAALALDAEFLLLEGLVIDDVPALEVHRPALGQGLRYPPKKLAAVVCDEPLDLPLPRFAHCDLEGIIRFMEETQWNQP